MTKCQVELPLLGKRARPRLSNMATGEIRVVGLNVFPIKSCRACSVQEVTFNSSGVVGDRDFMIVDASSSRNVSQKHNPNLVSICPRIVSEGGIQVLYVSSSKADRELRVVSSSEGTAKEVIVLSDRIAAYDQGEEAAEWLTNVMEQSVRLVYVDAKADSGLNRIATKVPSSLKDKFSNLKIGLANSAPVSLASVESLADVNKRLLEETNGREVPLDRFRMNVEVDGCSSAFEEDDWQFIRIGGVPFLVYIANEVSIHTDKFSSPTISFFSFVFLNLQHAFAFISGCH